MAKTALTKLIEYAIWLKTNGLMYGCREVKIGLDSNRHLLTNREEYVDYMTISRSGEITCYEIKVSKSDFKSKAALSFEGHRNYIVLPDTLYDEIKDTDYFKEKLPYYVGVITFYTTYSISERSLTTVKNCKKRDLSIGTQTLLMESLMRSLNREANKFYKVDYASETVKIDKKELQELKSDRSRYERLASELEASYRELSNDKAILESLKNLLVMHNIIDDTQIDERHIIKRNLRNYLEKVEK
jgi:hypothetical protein